jgi:hypothetical protein
MTANIARGATLRPPAAAAPNRGIVSLARRRPYPVHT